MNIFDWYEDKSLEEVAEELGITDLSFLETPKKEVSEILEKPVIGNHQEWDIDNEWYKKLRTSKYSLEDLRKWMTLKIKWGEEVLITEIESEDKIHTTKRKWERTTMPYSAIKATCLLSIYELDRNNLFKRINLTWISQKIGGIPDDFIIDWTYVRDMSGILFETSIGKVKKHSGAIEEYYIDSPFSKTKFSVIGFESNFAVHKSYFAQYQIRKKYNKNICPIDDIKDINVGDYIVDILEDKPKLRNIITIWQWSSNISVLCENWGHLKNVDKIDIKNGYYFVARDIDNLDIEDESLWTNKCDFKDLKKWMRINVFKRKDVFIIKEISPWWVITLEENKGSNSEVYENDIGKVYSIYSADLRKSNKENYDKIWISYEQSQDDTLWEEYDNIDIWKLKVGMRVRNWEDNWHKWDPWQISEINWNEIIITYINNKTWTSYMVFPCFDFDVFKEDLEDSTQSKERNYLNNAKKNIKALKKIKDSWKIHSWLIEN